MDDKVNEVDKNIVEFQNKIKQQRKLPEDRKKDIFKNVFRNIITAILLTVYFFGVNLINLYMDSTTFVYQINAFSIILLITAIIIFEKAYNKDDDRTAILGMEILVLSLITLFLRYVTTKYSLNYMFCLTALTVIFLVYYIIKSVITYVKEKKEYIKSLSDIKEIVKKNK